MYFDYGTLSLSPYALLVSHNTRETQNGTFVLRVCVVLVSGDRILLRGNTSLSFRFWCVMQHASLTPQCAMRQSRNLACVQTGARNLLACHSNISVADTSIKSCVPRAIVDFYVFRRGIVVMKGN